MEAKKPEPKRVVAINEDRFKPAEYVRNDWIVNAEEGTTPNDVLDPQYWAFVSPHLKPYDHIEVRLETGEWVMQLLVLKSERTYARVHLLHKHDLADPNEDIPLPQRHEVKWGGPQHKFRVIRIADGAVLEKGFENQGEAATWLRNYERSIGTAAIS